jgi:hypothetical protein
MIAPMNWPTYPEEISDPIAAGPRPHSFDSEGMT